MAVTKSEQVIGLLNYGLASRMSRTQGNNSMNNGYISDSYPNALKGLVDIYSRKAARGEVNLEEINDFIELLSCANYLGNYKFYPGLEQVCVYSNNVLSNFVDNSYSYSETNSIVR